jgi:hypothetical protein
MSAIGQADCEKCGGPYVYCSWGPDDERQFWCGNCGGSHVYSQTQIASEIAYAGAHGPYAPGGPLGPKKSDEH